MKTAKKFVEQTVPVDDESECERPDEPSCDIPDPDDADNSLSAFALTELILKNRPRLHNVIREPVRQRELLPRFLAIALISFVFYGVAMSLVLLSSGLWPRLNSIADVLRNPSLPLIEFTDTSGVEESAIARSSLTLITAYAFGLIAATGICLPSLYFYGLLAGVRMSLVDVVIHSLKSKATAAVALIGILPIYAAVCMGMVIFDASALLLRSALWLGLVLPFIAGLWGTYSLYVGFDGLCDSMRPSFGESRACFLRRLVLSWSAVYTAVTPVMIFSVWQWMQV